MTQVKSYRLLVVDDEPDLRTLYELALVREGYDVEAAATVQDAWQLLQDKTYHLIITDMRLPDGSGMDLIERLERSARAEKIIVITAYGSTENAIEALKAGAYDYLTKPVDLKQFRQVVASALGRSNGGNLPPLASTATSEEAGAARAPNRRKPSALTPLARLTGASAAMLEVRALINKVARSMAPVLLWGESGTGKELVARAIHDVSARASAPFIAVNCSAIPEQLLEAEFFGYRKGAFTGAMEDREGFFQAANGGTLFLDEIGDLPLSMQSKLLRVIQERAARPVGAVSEMPVDVRIISATHKELGQEVEAGRFRQDLFYRVNVIQIRLPALRERMQDLPELCAHILERIALDADSQAVPQLSPAAIAHLQHYTFPGNVRELENLLHRVLALSSNDRIEVEDLNLPLDDAPAVAAPSAALDAQSPPMAQASELPSHLETYLDTVERAILLKALEEFRYNRTAAGARLGLSLRQMRYRMARLQIEVEERSVTSNPSADTDVSEGQGSA